MTNYIAYAVNLDGVALASYVLAAQDDAAAAIEGRKYLQDHRIIDVWSTNHRRIARHVRED